jgi:HK97 family phage major capsid protein
MSKSTVSIYDAARPSEDFVSVARWLALGKGSVADAAFRAKDSGTCSPRALDILQKAAVDVGVITDPQFAGDMLSGFNGLSRAFVDSLANVGVFDAMLPSFRRVPINAQAAVMSVGASGASAAEGAWKKMSALEVEGSGQLTERKAVAAIVVSNDLLRMLSQDATALLRRELQTAVSLTTDTEAIDALTNGVSPISSLGDDAVRDDIAAMLQAISIGQGSKVFLLVRSEVAKHMALVMDPAGRPAFPNMRIDGGDVAGITVLVSDALDVGTLVMVDGSQVAAAGGFVALGTATQSTLRVSSTPDSDEALTSLWQKNLVAIRAERTFGAQRLRDSAVAVVTGAAYGEVTV